MNYTITEDEYNVIQAAGSQLRFVALLVANGADSGDISEADGLSEFLLTQANALKNTIAAAHQRHVAAQLKQAKPAAAKQVTRKNLAAKACTTVGGGV